MAPAQTEENNHVKHCLQQFSEQSEVRLHSTCYFGLLMESYLNIYYLFPLNIYFHLLNIYLVNEKKFKVKTQYHLTVQVLQLLIQTESVCGRFYLKGR